MKIDQLRPFKLDMSTLPGLLSFNQMMKYVFDNINTDDFSSKIDLECDHNFGEYAAGYRVYLTGNKSKKTLYIYGGLIYSHRKEPAGIFVEADRFSNQEFYETVYRNMEESPAYKISTVEDGFIKLFYPDYDDFIKEDSVEIQIEKLKGFINVCCNSFIKALN